MNDTPHTVPAALAHAVARFDDRPWMAFDDEVRSFRALGADVERIAAGLVAAGLRPGEGAGLFLGNGFEWLEVEYAAMAAGGWVVPINTWFRSRELEQILSGSGLTTLVWGGRVLGEDTRKLLGELVPELHDGPPGTWSSARFPALRTVVGIGDGPWPAGVVGWVDLLAGGAAVPAADVRARSAAVGPSDRALVMYTSGTTGAPKGAILSHAAVVDHIRAWVAFLGLHEADRSIMGSPLFWTFGCTLNAVAPLIAGSMIALLERFEAGAFVRALVEHRVTHLQGVPSQYELALAHPDAAAADLSSLRLIQIGGSASAEDLARRLLARAPAAQLISAYGLTEAVAVSTWTELDDPLADVVSTIGHVAPDLEASVRDPETGDEVTAGEVGELWLRGGAVMSGYIDAPDATAAALVDGWLRTGDLTVADARGYLAVVGRLVDAFKRGGMNVYPAEAESLLMEHPSVRFAAIIGVPDARLGEVGAAYVVAADGAAATERELIDWCEERLARYKVPAHIRFVDALPATATGKVTKFRLRELWDADAHEPAA